MTDILRQHAEHQFAEELAILMQIDDRPRPPNWRLSPWAAMTYVLGGRLKNGFEVTPKYSASRQQQGASGEGAQFQKFSSRNHVSTLHTFPPLGASTPYKMIPCLKQQKPAWAGFATGSPTDTPFPEQVKRPYPSAGSKPPIS